MLHHQLNNWNFARLPSRRGSRVKTAASQCLQVCARVCICAEMRWQTDEISLLLATQQPNEMCANFTRFLYNVSLTTPFHSIHVLCRWKFTRTHTLLCKYINLFIVIDIFYIYRSYCKITRNTLFINKKKM